MSDASDIIGYDRRR